MGITLPPSLLPVAKNRTRQERRLASQMTQTATPLKPFVVAETTRSTICVGQLKVYGGQINGYERVWCLVDARAGSRIEGRRRFCWSE